MWMYTNRPINLCLTGGSIRAVSYTHLSFTKALDICKKFNKKNPLKVAYKRVCRLLEERGMEDELIDHLGEFIKLESSNFHDHEFNILTNGLIDRGQREEAREILALGIRAYPRSLRLRKAWEEMCIRDRQ